MRKYLLTFLILFTALSISYAQEAAVKKNKKPEPDNDAGIPLDEEYESGGFLIYQCAKKHFGCVDRKSSQKCQLQRHEAQKKGLRNLQCVNLKAFPNTRICARNQHKYLERPGKNIFCKRGPTVSKPEIVSPSQFSIPSE